ncbi:hypothetical protein NC651_024538 [Populus alba x Populus x berolinensis]|nr:hypothetical protein NC651_024538 [Populus alba x Populus x berolinensis]
MQPYTLPILPFTRLETQESAIAKPCLCVLLPSVSPILTKELFYSLIMPPRPPTTSFVAVATTIVGGLPPVTIDHDCHYQVARMNEYPSLNVGKSLVLATIKRKSRMSVYKGHECHDGSYIKARL